MPSAGVFGDVGARLVLLASIAMTMSSRSLRPTSFHWIGLQLGLLDVTTPGVYAGDTDDALDVSAARIHPDRAKYAARSMSVRGARLRA